MILASKITGTYLFILLCVRFKLNSKEAETNEQNVWSISDFVRYNHDLFS